MSCKAEDEGGDWLALIGFVIMRLRESACIGAKVVRPIKLRKARGLFRMSQT